MSNRNLEVRQILGLKWIQIPQSPHPPMMGYGLAWALFLFGSVLSANRVALGFFVSWIPILLPPPSPTPPVVTFYSSICSLLLKQDFVVKLTTVSSDHDGVSSIKKKAGTCTYLSRFKTLPPTYGPNVYLFTLSCIQYNVLTPPHWWCRSITWICTRYLSKSFMGRKRWCGGKRVTPPPFILLSDRFPPPPPPLLPSNQGLEENLSRNQGEHIVRRFTFQLQTRKHWHELESGERSKKWNIYETKPESTPVR